MTDASFFTQQQASDPSTPATLLAEIARDRPDLRPLVAANPSTYPALLEWLGSLGDPQVDAALAARGTAQAAPEPPPGFPPPAGGFAGAAGGEQPGPYPGAAPGPAAGAYPEGYPQGAPPGGYAGAAGGAAAAGSPPPLGAPPYGEAYGSPAYGTPAGASPRKGGMSPWLIALLVAVPVLLIAGAVVFFLLVAKSVPAEGSYGSDSALDALYDQCKAGDMGACDDLWVQSPPDSEYEEFGDTCGGRQGSETNQWCDEASSTPSQSDPDAQSYGDDPELDRLYDRCEGGDLASCDQLYFQSPVGSDYEEFGSTCGNRQEPGALCDS